MSMIVTGWWAWSRRVRALTLKEFQQIRRDPSSYLIAGLLPLLLLFIFGHAVSLDLRSVAIAVVVEQATPEANSLLESFRNSPFFHVQVSRHRADVQEDLVAGRAKGIIVIPADFAARVARGEEAPVQLLLDGSEPNTAGLVAFYASGVFYSWLELQAPKSPGLFARLRGVPGITVVSRVWYNADTRSSNCLIPGSLAVIMSMIGTLLTALVVAREWERGTIEALMAMPVGKAEFLLGKLIPYFLLGMGAMAIASTAAVCVFRVPFRGSPAMLATVSAAFLFSMLSLGLLISTVTRNQFAASQTAIIATFLPAFDLSGFVFELDSTPLPIQCISWILPARHFVSALQTMFLVGDVPAVLIPATLALIAIGCVPLACLIAITRMRLE